MAASKTPRVRLAHIRDEIVALTAAFDGVGYDEYERSYVLRRTAEHAILIISEAAKSLPVSLTDAHPEIDWRAIRDIGNVLRHDYFEVDAKVLWRVITDRLPELRIVINRMIDTND